MLFRRAAFDERKGALRTYLFGVARRVALRRLNLEQRESEEEADTAAADDTLGELLQRERAAVVEQAVAALLPLQKEAIILFEYEDLPVAEIAEITGAEVGTVKVRLHRARETLRRKLAPLFGPNGERRDS